MKIYFACSIRGGREGAEIYPEIIKSLKNYGQVLSEHFGDPKFSASGESLEESVIHDRDLDWVREADVIVAEVSTPSLGVGYEIGRAIENGKRVLCLYRNQADKKLSAMITGCSELTLVNYDKPDEINQAIEKFFK